MDEERKLTRSDLATFLRRIAPFLRQQRGLYVWGGFFELLTLGTALLWPQLIRTIIDEGVQMQNMDRVNGLCMLMGIVLLLQAAGVYAKTYVLDVASQRATTQIRRWLLGRMIVQEPAFFDQQNTGDLLSRVNTDAGRMNYTLREVGPELLHFTLLGSVAIGLMFWTSWVLSVVVLMVGPLIWGGTVLLGRRLRNEASRVVDAQSRMNRVGLETLSSYRTIRLYNQEEGELERFRVSTDALDAVRRREAKAVSQRDALSGFFSEGAVLLAIWVGGSLILRGSITPGAVVTFILYAAMVMRSLRNLTRIGTEVLRAEGATQRIFGIGEREPELPVAGGRAPEKVEGSLALDGVSFAYESRPDATALHAIDLVIPRGEVLALVGASGSGKSTITALIARLYDPDSGTVRFDGRDLRELDPAWLREQVTLVPAEATLFARSVADNIRFGCRDASDHEVEEAARTANADGFIRELPEGYQTDVGERGQLLSSGQRQRIAIARAVLRGPRVLILDEATAALDGEGEAIVKESLRKLPGNRTLIIVSHRLSTVADVDRVVLVEGGRIVAMGTHDELLAGSVPYRKLVEEQLVTG